LPELLHFLLNKCNNCSCGILMENTKPTPHGHCGLLEIAENRYQIIDLPERIGSDLYRLPVVLRLLLENLLRHTRGAEQETAQTALLAWLDVCSSEAEIPFQPGRVLMHDTTSTPALVDIAAMRDALHESGADPRALNPSLPVDVSVDHSLAVEAFGRADAAEQNMAHEIRRNAERYRFLRWASKALKGVRIHAPGTGIMHTINLEQLATVVTTEEREGQLWAVPDMMLGTDSHTPMVNGIGVLGWGVGGLEAQTVMFGMPTMLRIPEVIGVKLTGHLQGAAQATDLALVVTQRLRQLGVTGEFVEFFGTGVCTLSAGDRCVIANMAPEYGATTGFFPVDDKTLVYLRSTGRREAQIELVRHYCQRNGLWFDPQAEPRYTKTIEIQLSEIGIQVAGPRRPQDLLDYSETGAALAACAFKPSSAGAELPAHPVAFAAITSCTNTSDPALLIAAGLLARKARSLGLQAAPWVKTSLAPGSPAARDYLQRCGLLEDLAALGFDVVGFGCTTCIGNPGPLPETIVTAQTSGQVKAVAILSGNRNFPGRVHPDIELSFIMSPMLVVAFALAGDAGRNLRDSPLAQTRDGQTVWLRDLLPSREEIESHLARALDPSDFRRAFDQASRNPLWHALQAPDAPLFPWNEASTALRRPPFAARSQGSLLGRYSAYPLMVLGDDVTTDHISPASAIPKNSLVADFLVARGDDRNDLNVFASRRGNWQVMMRAAFHNKTLTNHLRKDMPVAHTLHIPSGDVQPIWDVAERYAKAGESVVLIAGERYGMGSSRDWAAKGQRLLGIRAVIAASFERIHRSNLIGMGIVPLGLDEAFKNLYLQMQPGDHLELDLQPAHIAPRARVSVMLVRNGESQTIETTLAIETQLELQLLREGGVIPSILRKTDAAAEKAAA
jgi:aconitate hydratase